MFGNGFRLFSLAKLINGLNRTLNVANELIPIYKEAKPVYSNVKNAINVIKNFSNTTNAKIQTNIEKNTKPLKQKISTISTNQNHNNPTFFQ